MREIVWLPIAQKAFGCYPSMAVQPKWKGSIWIDARYSGCSVGKISQFPFIMQKKKELLENYAEDFRSLVVRRHIKIIYFVESEEIVLSAIWDRRQDSRNLIIETK